MDNKGRNVAVAFATSDYFQGDEAKWLETFGKPLTTRHRAPPEPGHDGTFVAVWISAPLIDVTTQEPIGAVALETIQYGSK